MINEIEKWQQEVTAIKRELRRLPKGYLIKRRNFYYRRIGTREQGITKNVLLIRKLARKAYLLARLKQLEDTLNLSKTFTKRCTLLEPQELIHNLSRAYQDLPTNYFFPIPDDGWANQPYEKNTINPEGLTILTNSGLFVRSKSELIIANALDDRGIPYRYEEKLVLGNQIRYPDFKIKRPLDGFIILWEHFGGDSFDYLNSTKSKIALYAQYGYLPFHNFICTFENDVKNSKYVFDLIDMHLTR